MKKILLLVLTAYVSTSSATFAQHNVKDSEQQQYTDRRTNSTPSTATETIVALRDHKEETIESLPAEESSSDIKASYTFRHHEEGFYSGTSLFKFGLDIGLNRFVNEAESAPDLDTFGSRYISLNWHPNFQIGGVISPFYLVSGLEFSFNNYMFDNNIITQNIDNTTQFTEVQDVRVDKSKLSQSAISIPLMPMLKFKQSNGSKGFMIGAGGFAGYRIGSHSKLKYEENNSTIKYKVRDDYNLTNFQYGLTGVIGYGAVNFFVKYHINDLFREDDRGPQANVISFGLRIFSY